MVQSVWMEKHWILSFNMHIILHKYCLFIYLLTKHIVQTSTEKKTTVNSTALHDKYVNQMYCMTSTEMNDIQKLYSVCLKQSERVGRGIWRFIKLFVKKFMSVLILPSVSGAHFFSGQKNHQTQSLTQHVTVGPITTHFQSCTTNYDDTLSTAPDVNYFLLFTVFYII